MSKGLDHRAPPRWIGVDERVIEHQWQPSSLSKDLGKAKTNEQSELLTSTERELIEGLVGFARCKAGQTPVVVPQQQRRTGEDPT